MASTRVMSPSGAVFCSSTPTRKPAAGVGSTSVQIPPVTDVRQLTAELVVDFKRQLLAMRETLPDGTLVSAARKQSYADTFHRRFHT